MRTLLLSLALPLLLLASAPAEADVPKQDPAARPAAGFQSTPMLRRFLDGPMKEVDDIVFAVRVPGRDHWYVTFGNYSDHSLTPPQKLGFKFEDGVYWGYGEGGKLCRLNLRTGQMQILLDDATGGVRDPQLHYGGEKILFSYRPGSSHTFHLYEIGIDGKNLVQLTDGPDDDIEPTYAPDGSIVFCSSRCRRFVNCWYTRVAVLYRCDADGSNVRPLSSNNDHDNTPWVLPDGRVLYMRWEYVDRSQVHFHHLWTMNPDGTSQTVFYGNLHGGIAMLDAKPIPGTRKVVASFSPGHGRPEHLGHVAIVDPGSGPDNQAAARQITQRPEWKDPYAFSEDCFVVARRDGLHVMDGQGNSELIYQLSDEDRKKWECNEPRPVLPRPLERVIPERTDLARGTGRIVLENIYHGRKMASVRPGTVKKLLVLKQVPKPINHSGGMEPLTIGGTFTLAQILGTVPVEADGSAYMELPALQSLFFVALDENDLAVKRMHSFVTLQPGESLSCVGCHEQRNEAPHKPPADMIALRRAASRPEKAAGVPDVMDFSRDIQPILDKHCVSCHNPDRRDGEVELVGDKTPMHTISYLAMQTRGLVADGRNREESNYEPYLVGSSASRLMKLIDGSHYGAAPSERERTLVRLWLDTSATYPGTYASLGCGNYPVIPDPSMTTFHQRCGACHFHQYQDPQHGEVKTYRFAGRNITSPGPWFNLSRPDKSLFLRAPLAKSAGGLQVCKEVVFNDTADPLYRALLSAIEDGQSRLMAGRRFDMPGFRPTEHYIREMQRFGFLPKSLAPNDTIDVYAVDKAYWDSFTYQPPQPKR
ncbi:MAG: HzsA-related protein [Thermoguttaceae bacterium]